MARPMLPLLTAQEAAEQLGISVADLDQMRLSGQISYVRLTAKTLRYRPAEVAVLAALLEGEES